MVIDLGRDYYHMSPPELDALGDKIRNGDMEDVLRVYEKELQASSLATLDSALTSESSQERVARKPDQDAFDPSAKDQGKLWIDSN